MNPEELRWGLRSSVLDDTTADEILLAVQLAADVLQAYLDLGADGRSRLHGHEPALYFALERLARGPK